MVTKRTSKLMVGALAVFLTIGLAIGPVAAGNPGKAKGKSKAEKGSKEKQQGASKRSNEGKSSSAAKPSQGKGSSSSAAKSSNGNGNGNGSAASASKSSNGKGNGNSASAAKSSNGKAKAKGRGNGNGKGKDKGFPYETGTPGNNGTVKIRSTGDKDGNRRNEPHPGCEFWLHMWNFDEPASGTATFTAHSPTGSGETLLVDDVTVGQYEVAGSYDLAQYFQALGVEPHHKQGYHVKLTLNADYSQGADTKHKVFWINCPGAPGGVGPDEVEPTVPGDEDDGNGVGVDEQPTLPEEEDRISDDEVAGLLLQARGAAVEGVSAGLAQDAAQERGPSGVLPFTGASLALIILGALGLIGGGAAFWRARRS